MNAVLKSPEQLAQSGKDMIDAFAKSFSAFTSCYHELHQYMASHAHHSITTAMSAGREALDVKTPTDLHDYCLKVTSEMMGATVSHAAKCSQLSVKMIDIASEPLKRCFSNMAG